jgi:hypothetical protein
MWGIVLEALAGLSFAGLTIAERDYPHWAWLLPAGLLLLVLSGWAGKLGVWRRR